ncbi:MAG TPA: diiron oxygenase [Verrucomicrobiae bacterium]|jgi:hypothetical protein
MSDVAINFSRRFIPEHLTPLRHTASYAKLSEEQRLRYNQLHSLYLNEQTIFFESAMAQYILRDFAARELPDGLGEGLRTFFAEEAEHSKMFRELNRLCRPDIYAKGDFYFIRVPALSSICLTQWVRRAHWFPFFLWILLVQEERASFFAREYLKEANELEPHFVATQRRHLADEVGHIQWDEELLDWVWPRVTKPGREFNAWLFAWMMREYFTTPKRSGLRVVAELVKEFPALRPLWPEFRRQMLELSGNERFNLLCYSREVTPKTFARFDQWPEFQSLKAVFPGYQALPENSKP